jgi:hypothetical protein
MINNVSSSSYVNPVSGQTTTNAANSVPGIGTPASYGTDSFSSSNNYATLSTPSSMPISQLIAEDPAMANRFSTFFMGTSDRFLKVGSSWLGRSVLNLLAGNFPLLTSSTASTQISNNINAWLGRADIVRAGTTAYEASVLQDVGIKNINDLAAVTNPSDQAVVAQMMVAASTARGQTLLVQPGNVANWVAKAQSLPKYL